jgi:hypothetical protein
MEPYTLVRAVKAESFTNTREVGVEFVFNDVGADGFVYEPVSMCLRAAEMVEPNTLAREAVTLYWQK